MLLKERTCFDGQLLFRCSHIMLGRVVLSGSASGHIVCSSLATGLVIRVLTDHHGAAITCLKTQSDSVRAIQRSCSVAKVHTTFPLDDIEGSIPYPPSCFEVYASDMSGAMVGW